MKVIITGGTGLIGSALTASLIEDGHIAVVLSRYPIEKADRVPGANIVGWDGKTPLGWAHLIKVAKVILSGQRAIPARLEALGFKFTYPELEPALREILNINDG